MATHSRWPSYEDTKTHISNKPIHFAGLSGSSYFDLILKDPIENYAKIQNMSINMKNIKSKKNGIYIEK